MWDFGPFDNDQAADWCDDLDKTNPSRRAAVIRKTLKRALRHRRVGFDVAQEAIAAAAVVASQRDGGPPVESPYAPEFLRRGGRLDLPDEAAELAIRALDRIVGDESEWAEFFRQTPEANTAFTAVSDLRTALVG